MKTTTVQTESWEQIEKRIAKKKIIKAANTALADNDIKDAHDKKVADNRALKVKQDIQKQITKDRKKNEEKVAPVVTAEMQIQKKAMKKQKKVSADRYATLVELGLAADPTKNDEGKARLTAEARAYDQKKIDATQQMLTRVEPANTDNDWMWE